MPLSDDVDELAKLVLRGDYGGPALGYKDGEFVVYHQLDAPPGSERLGTGKTIYEALRNAYSILKSRGEL